MEYRKSIETTEGLAEWYSQKYREMGDGWNTPVSECNRHLDDLGVPFDKGLRLLDIGCGAGHFLAEAEKRVECCGSEISEVGTALSRNRARYSTIANVSIENNEYWNTASPFNFIVSMGSLEHVVDLPKALDNIRELLKPNGKFYFFCPNEKWKHFDQPNERTMEDAEWIELFNRHGLYVESTRRWNDSTAFIGNKHTDSVLFYILPPHGTKLNVGSGQRPFDTACGWINMDCNERWHPDVVGNWNDLSMFEDGSLDLVVSHHSLEHVGCGEGDGFIREAHRVLKEGGSLLVFVPDMKALAQRWLTGELDDYQYFVNVYGAYMGDEADRHKWGYSRQGLVDYLKVKVGVSWKDVHAFNWREIPGADIAKDWWITGIEAIK